MTEPLKPSPFCGGPARWLTSDIPYDYEIGCAAEDCPVYLGACAPTAAEAIAAWNRRAQEKAA